MSDEGWIEHDGSKCSVDPNAKIEAWMAMKSGDLDGWIMGTGLAKDFGVESWEWAEPAFTFHGQIRKYRGYLRLPKK